MLSATNKERIEQEIVSLIKFISDGRRLFYKITGFSRDSSDNFLNHFVSKDIFSSYPELTQTELNIQLLYVKLASYYELIRESKARNEVKKARNAFAHELTDLIFNKRVNYNFFLHKVSENFKKLQFIFYDETAEGQQVLSKIFDIQLDKDINDFLKIWSKVRRRDLTDKIKIPSF